MCHNLHSNIILGTNNYDHGDYLWFLIRKGGVEKYSVGLFTIIQCFLAVPLSVSFIVIDIKFVAFF